MAGTIKDSFLDLEKHRQLLEENVEKLRIALRHWQTWEAEYEGLKEEIVAADPPPNRQQLVLLARGYDGALVNRKEVEDILGPGSRSAAQMVNILDRRMDYVEQNIKAMTKQVEAAENKLAAATIISTPEVRNEEGLPLTDIIEELDEEGNVISSHTTTPGSAKPQLLEVLQKAGVALLSSIPAEMSPAKYEKQTGSVINDTAEVARPAKKGVKFAEDTKPGPEPQKSRTAKRVEDIMSIAKRSEERASEPPIIPSNESSNDAEMRREMLQYGMSEVGAVVAELNLEDGSDWSDDDYEDGTSDTDDEDQFGRSRGSIVDDELRQRMIELEERLGARVMENIGKKGSDPVIVKEGIGRITINGQIDSLTGDSDKQITDAESDGSSATSTNLKKAVRFSEDLDISPAPQSALAATPVNAPPITDVVERTAPAASSAPPLTPTSTPQKKTSRFKSERIIAPKVLNGPLTANGGSSLQLQPLRPSKPRPFSQPIEFPRPEDRVRVAPSGPEGKTLAATIVERDVPLDALAAEPDELDPHLLQQEVATEYHRLRNRMIQREGGFMKEEESETVPFSEEEGGPKKMSRFKAARLAKS